MNKKEIIEKKEIPSRTATKALINGFVAYGILFIFIIFILAAIFNWIIGNMNIPKSMVINISISCLASIILFFLFRILCKISTYDVLKKCKIKTEDIDVVYSNMKIFFIGFAIFSFMITSFSISMKYNNSKFYMKEISNDYIKSFENVDIEIANVLTQDKLEVVKHDMARSTVSIIIVEFSILISCIYLIFYQKRMILFYNEKDNKVTKNN